MKVSIRTRFTLGMIFFFVVIAAISILSAYHLNRLSQKTDAILKDNHFSVIFARDMAEGLTMMNEEITRCYTNQGGLDIALINTTSNSFKKSLQLEKNNLTEPGEDKLASGIESGFNEYLGILAQYDKKPVTADAMNTLQTSFKTLYQQTTLLSQMNEQAIILKADDTKKSAQKGLTGLTAGTDVFILRLSVT